MGGGVVVQCDGRCKTLACACGWIHLVQPPQRPTSTHLVSLLHGGGVPCLHNPFGCQGYQVAARCGATHHIPDADLLCGYKQGVQGRALLHAGGSAPQFDSTITRCCGCHITIHPAPRKNPIRMPLSVCGCCSWRIADSCASYFGVLVVEHWHV